MKLIWERYGAILCGFLLLFLSFLICDVDALQAASSVNYQSPLIDFGVGIFCFGSALASFIVNIADILSRRIKQRKQSSSEVNPE